MALIKALSLLLKSKKATAGVIKKVTPTLGRKLTKEYLKKLKLKKKK